MREHGALAAAEAGHQPGQQPGQQRAQQRGSRAEAPGGGGEAAGGGRARAKPAGDEEETQRQAAHEQQREQPPQPPAPAPGPSRAAPGTPGGAGDAAPESADARARRLALNTVAAGSALSPEEGVRICRESGVDLEEVPPFPEGQRGVTYDVSRLGLRPEEEELVLAVGGWRRCVGAFAAVCSGAGAYMDGAAGRVHHAGEPLRPQRCRPLHASGLI